MTAEEFLKIAENNQIMGELKDRYEILKSKQGISEINMSGLPTGSTPFDTSMDSVGEIVDIETEYKLLYYENESLIRRARKHIEKLPARIACILELRYINNLDAYEVANHLGTTDDIIIEELEEYWKCN